MRVYIFIFVGLLALLVGGCGSTTSQVDPAGDKLSSIESRVRQLEARDQPNAYNNYSGDLGSLRSSMAEINTKVDNLNKSLNETNNKVSQFCIKNQPIGRDIVVPCREMRTY